MSYFILEKELEKIKNKFHGCFDIENRLFKNNEQEIMIVFIKSIISSEFLAQNIYEPIQNFNKKINFGDFKERIIKCGELKEINESDVINEMLDGKAIIMTNFSLRILAVDIKSYPVRIPSEPPTSPVIQGPREGFVEDIQTNITLIRRRIKSPDLTMQMLSVGRITKTKICVSYIDGIANPKIIKAVLKKIKKIDIDGIIDSYYLFNYLQERPNSLFKQIGSAEKPDIVVSKLLEGKVAIIVDSSPIVLTVPFIFIEDLQNSNDYYTNHHYSSFVRVIRILGLILAIMAPGVYLSMQIFHYSILPLNFLITIADTTQGLPFTPFLEILFIFLLFQILYEVSLRLPSYLGLATSVVGALILGDTGVKAGLISPPGVIIVALSKIALYTIPEQASQITLLQFIFILIGGSLGLVGMICGCVYVFNYLNNIDNYGTPYLAPYSPRIRNDLQDAIWVKPMYERKMRPKSFNTINKERKR